MKLEICADCQPKLIAMMNGRVRRILEVAAEESENEEDQMHARAECFHLMEIIQIIEGKKTFGVFDDYGDPPTIKGPLFGSFA